MHPPNLANIERTHGGRGVINLLSAIQANHVSLLLQSKWTGQVLVTATKDCFIQKIENRAKNIHELVPSYSLRNLGAFREMYFYGAQSGRTAVHCDANYTKSNVEYKKIFAHIRD